MPLQSILRRSLAARSPAVALLWCAISMSWVLSSGPSYAAGCQVPTIAINLCKRCTSTLPGVTSRDTECTGYPPSSPSSTRNVTDLVVLAAKLAKPPQHGTAVVNGQSWTYRPAKGFTGHDTFTMERDYLQERQLYVLYFKVEMDVQP